jgi:hypothetical protein
MQLCRHPPVRWPLETFGLFGSAFFTNFSENLSVERIMLCRKSDYREDYVWRNLKMFIGSRIYKVMDSYYCNDSVDSMFILILNVFLLNRFL